MTVGASRNDGRSMTPFLALTLLAVFFFVLKDYHLPIFGGYAVFIGIAFFFVLLNGGRVRLTNTKKAAVMLAIVATVMVFLPYARTAVGTISVVLSLDVAMLYIVLCQPDEADVKRTMRILLVSAVLMSVYAVGVKISPDLYYSFTKKLLPADTQALTELGFKYNYGVSVGGESIVVDYYAFYGLVISLNTILLVGGTKARNRYIAVIAVCVLAIFVQNRKAELVTTLLVVLVLFFSRVNVSALKKRWKRVVFFSVLVIIGVAAFRILLQKGYVARYEEFFELLMLRSTQRDNTVDVSSGRSELWARAFQLFKAHPVFGIGWGNFRNHLSDTYNVFNAGQLSNVHNNYLQLLCETGVVGFVLFASPLFYILRQTVKTARYLRVTMPENHTARIAASTSLSFQLFFLGISFIDPAWYKMFTWLFYGVSVGLLLYSERCVELSDR